MASFSGKAIQHCCLSTGKHAIGGYFRDNGASQHPNCFCCTVKLEIEWVSIIRCLFEFAVDIMKDFSIRVTHKGNGIRVFVYLLEVFFMPLQSTCVSVVSWGVWRAPLSCAFYFQRCYSK